MSVGEDKPTKWLQRGQILLSIKIIRNTFWSIQELLYDSTQMWIRRIILDVSVQTINFSKKIGNFVYFAKERKGIFLTRRRGRPGLGLVTSWQLFGNFWDFRQLLKFLATFNFLTFLKLFFTFFATFISFRKKSQINSIGVHYCVSV